MIRGDADDTWVAISQALRPLSESSPGGASRWKVTVLLDAAPSMAVWSDIVDGVVEVLRGHADFGDVTVLPLDPSTMDATGPDRSIVGPGRIVLILTDGTGPAWHAGTMLPLLSAWGRRSPIAVLDLLPQLQWYRTGIRPRRLRMWLPTPAPASANADFAWELHSPLPDVFDEPVGDDPVPVPVLELDSRWLAAWAGLLTGGESRLPALLAHDTVPQDVTVPATGQHVSARTRVREFTAWATPTAVTLATQLAAAPLNLALMRSVQRALIPDAQTSHLSEILNSELLYPVPASGAVPESAGIAYEFHRGVREELLAAGRRADAARVLRVVDEQLGPDVPAVRGLSRMLDDPDASPMAPVTPETAPFIRVERAVLHALSGRYLARARHLHEALGVEPEPSSANAATGPSFATMESAAPGTTDRRSEGAGVSSSRVADVATSPRTTAKAPVIWGNVPPRNPNFTGRESLLANLHEQMRVGTTAVLPHALQGMGGVGKSQLAVEFVYRHQHEYDVIWWIPSERPAQIGNALAELAQRLQLPVGPEANAAVPAVREALRLGQPYANWLLIFDNAESPEAVQRYFPNGGPGHIMVTSRNPQWSSIAQQLEVDVFARRESVDLLRRRGPEMNDDDAIRLAEALGDLPLALDQAAAWRAETGMPADEYLRLFEQKRTELLEVSVPLDYQLPVAAAWNVSLDRLADSSPGALRLLQVCSFFAPEPIPRALFSRGRAGDVNPELDEVRRDPMRLNRAIREINRYALAKIDYRTNSIQMHRLVQAVLMDRLDDAEQKSMRRSAHLLLADGDPNDPNSPDSWRAYADLYPHAMTSQAFRSTEPWVQQLVDNLSRYLYWWGDHHAAFELATRAYEARREQLGATHQSTLRMGHWMGWLLFVLGRFDEAAELNETVLNAYRETVDEDNEDLLRALGAVAADRRVAGDFKGALEMAEEVYQRHVRALGPDDVETITAAHNLAVSLRLTGELLRASEINEENQRLRIQLYGTEHPITLESTRNLITDRYELGDYVSARSEAQAVADQLSHQLTPGHPQTLRALRTLAVALRKSGDHGAARRISEQVQEGFLTRYGEDHPDTIAASLNLSSDLRETGDLEDSAELGERVYERYRRLLRNDRHPHVIAAKLNWAVTQRLRGRVDQARQMDEEGFAELREQLGDDHPLTLSAALNLASDLYAQGEYALAAERDTDAIERLARVLGPEHPTTLAGQGNLAMDLLKLGRLEESAEVHASAVANFRRLLGDDHPATAAAVDLNLRANCDMDPLPL